MISNENIKQRTKEQAENAIKEHAQAILDIQENIYDIENVLLSPLLSKNQELSALFSTPAQIQKAKIDENSIDYVLDVLTKYRQKLIAFAKEAYDDEKFQAKFGDNPLKTDTFEVDDKTDYEEKLIKCNLNIANLFINVISGFKGEEYSNENKLATQGISAKAKLGFALASPLLQLTKYQGLIDKAVKPQKSDETLQRLTTKLWYETYDYLNKLLAEGAFDFVDDPEIITAYLKSNRNSMALKNLVLLDKDMSADLQKVNAFNKAYDHISTSAELHYQDISENINTITNDFNNKVETFTKDYQTFASKEGKPDKEEKRKLTIARHKLEQEAKNTLQGITQHANEINQFLAKEPSILCAALVGEVEERNTREIFKQSFDAIKQGMVDLSNTHNKLMDTPELNEVVYENVIASFNALEINIEEKTSDLNSGDQAEHERNLDKLLSDVDKVEDMINEFNVQAKAELATTTEDAQAAKDAELQQFFKDKGLSLDYINKPKEEHVKRLQELAPKSISNSEFTHLKNAHDILTKANSPENPKDIFIIPFNKLAGGNTTILKTLSGLSIDDINNFNSQQIKYNNNHRSPADDISLRLRYKHPKKHTKEEKQLLKNKQELTKKISEKYQEQKNILDETNQIFEVMQHKQTVEHKYSLHGDSEQGQLLGELTDQLKSLEEKSPELQKHKSELLSAQEEIAQQAKAKTVPAPNSTKLLGVTIPELSLRTVLGFIGGAVSGYFINPYIGSLVGALVGAFVPDNVLSVARTNDANKTDKVSKSVSNEKSSTEVMFAKGMKPQEVNKKDNDEYKDENKENQDHNVKVGENNSGLYVKQYVDLNDNNNLESDIPKLNQPKEINTLSA